MPPETLDKLLALTRPETVTIDGVTFWTNNHTPTDPGPFDSITLRTLDALTAFLRAELDNNGPALCGFGQERLFLHVADPTTVALTTELDGYRRRHTLAIAEVAAPNACDRFRFGTWYDPEEFNIRLAAEFVENPDRARALRLIGTMTDEAARTLTDDGVTQQIAVRTGVAFQENEKILNPFTLAPYRTFCEIRQPDSPFILRVTKIHQIALFEADGGAWRLAAVRAIRDYLTTALADGPNIPILC